MRIFHCDRCDEAVAFAADRCGSCDAQLGYLSDQREVRVIEEIGSAIYTIAGTDARWWRCLNSAWGCNWMVPVMDESTWCRSCRLTRGRPDEGRPKAIEAWVVAEAAKRRLVHQLDEFALPIEFRSAAAPEGLAFDLVHVPGSGGITGHHRGIVTLDLAEADEHHRDGLRRLFGERSRTLIGHLRHEIGHHYWARLVGQTNEIEQFRALFGDERSDYPEAIRRHYRGVNRAWNQSVFVSPYATSHPLEDWAESFAHYLHIVDAVGSAIAHDLIPPSSTAALGTEQIVDLEFSRVLEAWGPINQGLDAIAESLGMPSIYPFHLLGQVTEKLGFIHRQIAAHVTRDRFYAVEGSRHRSGRPTGAESAGFDGDDHVRSEIQPRTLPSIAHGVPTAGHPGPPVVDRRLMTVLFTDIVNSTSAAAGAGDRAWIELLDAHDELTCGLVRSHDGRIVKMTGDGLIAVFESPSRAVACTAALHAETVRLGLPIRAGIHVGEIEMRPNDDIGGMGVHIASRVAGLGGSSQTIVSRTVKDLVVGSHFRFDDFGEHQLKGVDEPWRCYSLAN